MTCVRVPSRTPLTALLRLIVWPSGIASGRESSQGGRWENAVAQTTWNAEVSGSARDGSGFDNALGERS